jgi:hypothetical protein
LKPLKNSEGTSVSHVIVFFAIGIATICAGYYGGQQVGAAVSDSNWLAREINSAVGSAIGLSVGLCFLGFALYALRIWNRLLYGILEVFIALGAILAAVSIYLFRTQAGSGGFQTPLDVLPIAAAVYVLVRGLDNMGEGFRKKGHTPAWWSWMFPEK